MSKELLLTPSEIEIAEKVLNEYFRLRRHSKDNNFPCFNIWLQDYFKSKNKICLQSFKH